METNVKTTNPQSLKTSKPPRLQPPSASAGDAKRKQLIDSIISIIIIIGLIISIIIMIIIISIITIIILILGLCILALSEYLLSQFQHLRRYSRTLIRWDYLFRTDIRFTKHVLLLRVANRSHARPQEERIPEEAVPHEVPKLF